VWYAAEGIYDSMEAPTAKPILKNRNHCFLIIKCEGTTVTWYEIPGSCWPWKNPYRVPRGEFKPVPPNTDYWPREPDPNNSTKSPKLAPKCG